VNEAQPRFDLGVAIDRDCGPKWFSVQQVSLGVAEGAFMCPQRRLGVMKLALLDQYLGMIKNFQAAAMIPVQMCERDDPNILWCHVVSR
jgi:hypothetical protein